jgi:hypothetical protein
MPLWKRYVVIALLAIGEVVAASPQNAFGAECRWALTSRSSANQIERTILEMEDAAQGANLRDPEFTRAAAKALDLMLSHRELSGYIYSSAARTVSKLGRFSVNRESLVPVYRRTLERFLKVQGSRATDHMDLLIGFSSGPVMRPEVIETMNLFFRLAEEKDPPRRIDEYLARYFRYLGAGQLRDGIIAYFLKSLKSDGRGHLYYFGQLNAIEELKQIPVALGVKKSLNRLSWITRSLNYREWDHFNWVKDAKAIPSFGSAFRTVVGQTSAVHFELGALLKDLPALARSFAEIRAKGERRVLRELAALHGDMDSPNLGNGRLSITNLELFWILGDPQFLAKTTFYEGYRPIDERRVRQIIGRLDRG